MSGPQLDIDSIDVSCCTEVNGIPLLPHTGLPGEEGVCDGCAERKHLLASFPVDDHNEPWLCRECHDEQIDLDKLCREVRQLRQVLAAVEKVCDEYETSPQRYPRIPPGKLRAALGAAGSQRRSGENPKVTPAPQAHWVRSFSPASHTPCPGPVTSTPEAATETDEQRILRQLHVLSSEAELYWQGYDDAKAGKPGRDVGAEIGTPSELQRATEQQQ